MNMQILVWLPITLRAERERRGWSQPDLARRAKVGYRSISSWETGERIDTLKFSQLLRIADALEISVETLFDAPRSEVTAPIDRQTPANCPPTVKTQRGNTIFRSSDYFQSQLGPGTVFS